jgi:hypothetical protein
MMTAWMWWLVAAIHTQYILSAVLVLDPIHPSIHPSIQQLQPLSIVTSKLSLLIGGERETKQTKQTKGNDPTFLSARVVSGELRQAPFRQGHRSV